MLLRLATYQEKNTRGVRDKSLHHIHLQYPGVWHINVTVHTSTHSKMRVRRSLGTKDAEVAKGLRDEWLAKWGTPEGAAQLEGELKLAARWPSSRSYGQWRRRQGLPSFTRSRVVRHSAGYLEMEAERIRAWRVAKNKGTTSLPTAAGA